MSRLITGLPRPTYASGFARSRDEAAYPWSWDGLVAHYDMGLGPTGGTLFDHGGRRLNGALGSSTAAPSWAVTQRGHVLDFDGSNDFASTPTIPLATRKLSIAFWMRWDAFSNNDDLALEHSVNYNNNSHTFLVNPNSSGGGYDVSLHGTSTAYLTKRYTRPTAGEWIHYGITLDRSVSGGLIRLWLNGVEQTAASTPNNTLGAAADFGSFPIYFMSRGGASLFGDGALSSFSLWSRDLSDGEFLLLSQGASPLHLAPRRKVWVSVGPSGDISGSTNLTFSATGAVEATGALAGSSTLSFSPTSTASGSGALAGASSLAFSPTATASGSGALTGSSTLTFTVTGTAGSGGSLTGSTSLTFSSSGTATGSGALAGSATLTFVVAGALSTGAITGSSTITFSCSGTLHGCRRYSGCVTSDYNYSTPSGNCSGSQYTGCNTDDYTYTSEP